MRFDVLESESGASQKTNTGDNEPGTGNYQCSTDREECEQNKGGVNVSVRYKLLNDKFVTVYVTVKSMWS